MVDNNSIQRTQTSAEAALTLTYPDNHQYLNTYFLLVIQRIPLKKFIKFVNNFFSISLTDKQTNAG